MPRFDWPCTAVVVALAIAATAASPVAFDALVADGPWRIVTGPFVHATWGHLIRDCALVAIAGVGYEAVLGRGVFVAGIVLPAIAVLALTDASWYCGLSGLSHALLAAAIAYEFSTRRGTARAIVGAIGAVCALKPIYELATGTPAFAMWLGSNVRQVPLAHATGVCVGLVTGSTRHCRTRCSGRK
jgi:membrane associated rhomboid family serine protease